MMDDDDFVDVQPGWLTALADAWEQGFDTGVEFVPADDYGAWTDKPANPFVQKAQEA